jgi:uncharacterized membrane protein YbhN (UPF0104 family)
VVLGVRIGISFTALWLAFRAIDLREVTRSIAAAGVTPIALTLGVYLVGQGVSALRWFLIARSNGFVLRPSTVVIYYFIGMFFNFLGPSLLGGDVARSLYLSRGRERLVAAAATVAFDRYVGFVWLAVLGSVAQIVFGSFSIPARLVWATHGLAIVALASWILLPAIGSERIPAGFFRVRAAASAISLVFHVIQIAGAIALVQAVSPATPWRYCFVFHPLVAIVSALPISIAGLGVRESGYVYFLSTVQGAPEGHAGAFAAAWLAVVSASSAIGGIVFLVSGGRLPRDRGEGVRSEAHSNQLPPSS